jgi:hypothetical protein
MEIKVRDVTDEVGNKSVQEIESELLEKHEREQSEKLESQEDGVSSKTQGYSSGDDSKMSEQQVLSFLQDRYGEEVNSLDELIEKRASSQDIPEDVAAYLKYRNETGRGFEDYLKLNQDYDDMDEDELLKNYLLSTEEGVDPSDIDVLLEDYSFDEELDDEADVKKKRVAKKKAVAKAKKFFNSQKEQYSKPVESSGVGMSPEEKKEFEAYKQQLKESHTQENEVERRAEWFKKKTGELFADDFKGFEFKVGDRELVYSPASASELKKSNSDITNFIGKFLDEDGLMKDATGYHKALSIAMNPEKFAQFFYEQGKSDAVDDVSRKSKNINMEQRKVFESSSNKNGLKIRAVSEPSNGNRLRIRSPRNYSS